MLSSNSDMVGPLTRDIFYQQNRKNNSDIESLDGKDINIIPYTSNGIIRQRSSCIEQLENISPIPISRPVKRKLNFYTSFEKNKCLSNNSLSSEISQNPLSSLHAQFCSSDRIMSNTSGFKVEDLSDNKLNHPLKLSYTKMTPSWICNSFDYKSCNGGTEKNNCICIFSNEKTTDA